MSKATLGFVKNCYSKKLLSFLFFFVITLKFTAQTNTNRVTYFEDFNTQGYPTNLPNNSYWTFHNEIYPNQDSWNSFIPGDGNAYITVDADITNDLDWIHPFQTLEFGGVSENHRLEVRMKGAVVDGGLVGFLFTYRQEGSIFNEVDIEIVADDSATPGHNTLPSNGGWTDARFNTWRNANENTEHPFTGTKKAVVNELNERISLIDNEFHTYTIDWRSNYIDFFIDGVLQETISTNVATGISEVIVGFRQLPWAGAFNWTGTQTMVIDYFKIEPLEPVTFATNDNYITQIDNEIDLDVLTNDTANTSIISYDALTVEGNTIIQNTPTLLTYIPATGFFGQDSFTYTIEDSEGDQASATVFLTVNPPPLNAENDSFSVTIQDINVPLDVLNNDSYGVFGENTSHPLVLAAGKIVTASNNGAQISVVNSKINYTPPNGFTGVDTFIYTITDANGFADTGTVTVNVGNDSITIEANDDNFSVYVDTATNLDVLTNDVTTGATISVFDTVSEEGFTITQNGNQLNYTPNSGFVGQDSFTYTIDDGNGTQSTASVTINVQEATTVNGPITAIDDSVTVNVGITDFPIDVTFNDSFGENGESATHPLTLTNGKINHASNQGGFISIVNGKVNYSAPNGFSGTDTFTYTITDANGLADTGIVTVNVGNDSITIEANDDNFSVYVDTATNLDVLTNDVATGATISVFDTVSAEGFTITQNGNQLNYTPNSGFIGQDSFTYTIEDVNGTQSTASVTVNVQEATTVNGPITAIDDSVTVDVGTINFPIDVTFNDSFGENGESATHPLTLTNGKINHASNQGGFISIVNGKVNYSVPTGFSGTDIFTYTITDANGFADVGTVTVNVIETSNKSSTSAKTQYLPKNENSKNFISNNEILVYPNPSINFITSRIYSEKNTKGILVLVDITGKTLYNKAITITKGFNEFELNLNLKPGIAFIKILSSSLNFKTTKVVIK